FLRKNIHRRLELHGVEGRLWTAHRIFPETRVEEERPRMVLVGAGPLDPFQLLQPPVGHSGMRGGERAQLVPDLLGGGVPPSSGAGSASRRLPIGPRSRR